MNEFLLMLSFFTRLPVGKKVEYTDERFVKALVFFPVTGLVIGLLLILPYAFPITVNHRTLLTIALYLWLTGGLHLDGLSDTLDGLLSNRKKEKILEIMKDSRIGAFGAIGLIFYFLALYSLLPSVPWLMVCFMPIVGKTMGLFAASVSTYARVDAGMGKLFIEHTPLKLAVTYHVMVFAGGTFLLQMPFALAYAGSLIFTWYVTRWCIKKIDGMTGDTIGLVIESSQMAFLFLGGMIC